MAMNTNKRLTRNLSSKMRHYQTGKFVRVLSYRNCSKHDESMVRGEKTELSASRFLMLAIFCLASMMSGVSYTTYTIIGDVVGKYFDVPYSTVNWTSMVYMLGYIIPLFPIILLIETKGLRVGFLVGIIGTAIGYWVTCVYISHNTFWVVVLGQTIIGAFQTCFMPLTPQFASVWFGAKEISSACSVGIFFNTLGNALSCIIPPYVVNGENEDELHQQLTILGFGYAIFTTVVAVFAVILFKEKPEHPPTLVQAGVRKAQRENTMSPSVTIVQDVKKLLTNPSFLLHMLSYGIAFSIADVTAAVLNHMVLSVNKDANEAVGILGLLIHLPGVPASLLFGVIMDRTHKYKETALVVYFAALSSFALFMAGFHLPLYTLYLASALLGFFGAGYLPIGLELGAEITYPIPEVTSSGLLIFSGAVFTLILTYATDYTLTEYGVLQSQLIILVAVMIGFVAAVFVKADLKRLSACEAAEADSKDDSEKGSITNYGSADNTAFSTEESNNKSDTNKYISRL